jgi:hypothetical protein
MALLAASFTGCREVTIDKVCMADNAEDKQL